MLVWLHILLAVAWAHPYGSNLYGHRTQVWLDRQQVRVAYTAEIPTNVLLRDLRRFLHGTKSPTQVDQDRHTAQWLEELQGGLQLRIDGDLQAWTRQATAEVSGVGDTRFIQYHLQLTAPLPTEARTLNLVNGNLPDVPSLFSTEVFIGDGTILDETSLIDVASGEVTADRDGQWRPEETSRELRMSFRLRGAVGTRLAASYRRVVGGSVDQDGDAYLPGRERLSEVEPEILPNLVKGEMTPTAVLIAIFLAVLLGALHAFSPGHGKALVAAYLLGERKTVRHAVGLGAIVTITHTVTVFALGGVALALSEVISTEALLPWLELGSGLLVLGVGAQLVRSRLRGAAGHHHHDHSHHDHSHHDHSHHDHSHHAHDHAHDHDHAHHDHHPDHDHDHDHDHHHHDHHHPDHDHDHDHDHHHHDHHHHDLDDPEAQARHASAHAAEYVDASGWRGLVALGVSGGIAPCPSALVLLLTAISFHRIVFGLILVFFFSLGLALLVTLVGVIVVLLGERLRGISSSGRVLSVLPILSALAITLLGVGITIKGVASLFGT